jgi:hypothetical protein
MLLNVASSSTTENDQMQLMPLEEVILINSRYFIWELYEIESKKFSGITVKLVRLIKMCLNETCNKVHIGKYLSDAFPALNSL